MSAWLAASASTGHGIGISFVCAADSLGIAVIAHTVVMIMVAISIIASAHFIVKKHYFMHGSIHTA